MQASLTVPPQADLISGDNPVYIGNVNRGQSRTVDWTIVFVASGVFNLDVSASGYRQDTGAYVERLGSATVTVHACADIDVDTAYNVITSGLYPNLVVLDVRTQDEYDSGHIYGAVWIPVSELEARIGELVGHKNREILVYCRSGVRSVTACGILDSHGFTKVYNMLGGILAWQSAGYPVWIATVHNINTTFNYDTIQAAIDAPQTLDGHTIFVLSGTYYEHVILSKSLSIVGENKDTTIIDGNETFVTVVHIMANNVSIQGFTIQNDAPTHCFEGGGIYITNSSGANVVDNIITHTEYAINFKNSASNTVIGNTITENDVGVQFLDEHSINNTIHHNNFINNGLQVSDFGASNIWDNGCEGNYWSDYNGTDLDGDGVGDEYLPWEAVDYCPLMSPYMLGDVNHDSVVNIYDVVTACVAYGSTRNDPNWNCHCDMAKPYGKIDIYDVVTVCANYGKGRIYP
jgi:parallel beta-helix repeat protein